MRVPGKEVFQPAWTMAKVLVGVVAIWLLVGLFLPVLPEHWIWGLAWLFGCAAITGYWRSWKQNSLLGISLGVVVAVVLLVGGLSATPESVMHVSLISVMYATLYASLGSVIAAAAGFLVARASFARHSKSRGPRHDEG
jgi:hypothetical protein